MVLLDMTFSLGVMGIPGCFTDQLITTPVTLTPMAYHCLWVIEGKSGGSYEIGLGIDGIGVFFFSQLL